MKEKLRTSFSAGLSGTALKMIALICMVFDHLHYFFGYTGLIPDWFSMLGRISAPLFLFCVAEGFAHTRNRKRYFLRVYCISALMGGFLFLTSFGVIPCRPDGFVPMNAIMMNFVILMALWQGIDWLKQKRVVAGLLAILLPLIWPIAANAAAMAVPALATPIGALCFTLLPAWSFISDGGLFFILGGVILYALRGQRRWQAAGYALFTLAANFALPAFMLSSQPGFSIVQMFTQYYEWFGVAAVALMLLYNGQRGKGYQKLFYVFYPAHVYILYALSWAAIVLLH